MKLIVDFMQLRLFSGALNTAAPNLKGILNPRNQRLLLHEYPSVKIIFSEDVSIPCTFGCLQKRIVLPAEFMDDPEKLNMAVRHELVHIKSNDFLVHTTVRMIRALFSFHPLVHKIAANIEPYREMNCDQHVLQDADISQQNYARLLFELLPQPIFKTAAAVNMAVNPSTLKKRIQTMKQSTPKNPSLRWSFSLMLACTLTLTGLMACSDIEEGGITRSEVEETQTQANNYKIPTDDEPLVMVNGEEMKKKNWRKLKPRYIKSIEVLKGHAATEKFGDAGQNGIIDITLNDKEKALSDLLTDEEMKAKNKISQSSNISKEEIYLAVEKQPQLKVDMAQLQSKVKYPAECKSKEIEGRVTVQFVVDTQGKVQDPNVIRGIGGGCDEEALRVIKQAEFTPGTQRGKKVNVQMSMPIVFKMNS
jgi:TonB family protein